MKSIRYCYTGRAALALMLLVFASCTDELPAPALTTLTVTLPLTTAAQGQTETATAAGVDQNGTAIGAGTVGWTSSTATVATINPASGLITAISPGTTTIVATSGAITGQKTLTVLAPPAIKVNEVESNGGTPGDWAEFYNSTTAAVDLSGWVMKDNDDTHVYTFPAGTTIAPGGYFVAEEANFIFGLGAPDAVRIYNPFGVLVDTYAWTTHATTTYGRCPNITGALTTTTTSTKGAANDCSASVRINEVESNGGVPDDWIELYNSGAGVADLSGYVLKDNDDTHIFTIPAGTTIAPGAYMAFDVAPVFGLGSSDAARLFTPAGTLVDAYVWTAHATTTYGRCPDGTGDFTTTLASSKGIANSCTVVGPGATAWPGTDDVHTVDGNAVFGGNLSGLIYEDEVGGGSPAVLWGVRNGLGTLFRLILVGGIWTPDPANGWGAGKFLRYTDGTGDPDAEGVTFSGSGSSGGIYVSTERNNSANTISRLSVLRFDPSAAGATLTATNDWNLTADLPVSGANLGLEAITYVPDSYLVTNGFFDETLGRTYAPADYANHGTGLFFVGLESNGVIYAYALNHVTNGFTRVATISSGYTAIMDLQFDRELKYLWAVCDDGCGGEYSTLEINTTPGPTQGRFHITHVFARPASMPNLNNEGFAMGTQLVCVAGFKPVFWADDGETGGHSIRQASLPCARFP